MCGSAERSNGVDKRDVVALTLFGEGAPTISPIPPPSVLRQGDRDSQRRTPRPRASCWRKQDIRTASVQLIIPGGRVLRQRLGVTLQQLLQPAGFELDAAAGFRFPATAHRFPARRRSTPTASSPARRRHQHLSFPAYRRQLERELWHYSNATVDKALDAGRLSGDMAAQKTDYIAFQEALVDDPASSSPIPSTSPAPTASRWGEDAPDALVRSAKRHDWLTRLASHMTGHLLGGCSAWWACCSACPS